MKKSTGILFLVALILAGAAYFYEWKRPGRKDDESASSGAKPAFTIKQENIRQISVTRSGMTMVFDLKSDGWHISQPISSRADQSAVIDLANNLTILPEDRTISNVSAADLNNYGLGSPALVVEFKLQDGATHKVQIGGKDFSNLEVYALLDGAKDVALISNIIVAPADKPLEAFRDHSVLALDPSVVKAFELDNGSGMMSAQADDTGWKFVKPVPAPGNSEKIKDMLGNLARATISNFVSDNANDLAKYGLSSPAIRFRATLLDGTTRELLIGKKEGAGYDAQDTSQSVLFAVPETTRTTLNQTFDDLRSKALFAGQDENVAHVEVHNHNGVTACTRDASGTLLVDQAAGQPTGRTPAQSLGEKEPAPACPDFMGPLERALSRKIYDQPTTELSAKLATPAIQVTVTDVAGKKTDIQISAPSGDAIYGRTSAGPSIYEFDKTAFTEPEYTPSSAK